MLWQLSKQRIRWLVPPDLIKGSGVDLSRSSIFWGYPLTSCYFLNNRRLKFNFFECIENKLCLWAALMKLSDADIDTSDANIQPVFTGMECSYFWLTMVTRWSRSTSNFYALIGQNLTGEFMRKINASSGNLFTDSWSWQSFVSSCDVLNCIFPLDVQNEIQLLSRFFCYSCMVCLLSFWLRNAPLVKVVGNPIADGIVFTSLDV